MAKETKATTTVENVGTTTPTFTKVKNVANRPLEFEFADGKGPLRIASRAIGYIDEARLAKSSFAQTQLNNYVKKGNLRILAKNQKRKEV